jgi:hypothetical protein
LKSWTTENELYSVAKRNGLTRKQPTKSIAKRNNLYTLPTTFIRKKETMDSAYQELITENLLFNIWEDRWPNVLNGLKNNKFTNDQIRDLKGFIITQSFRTPKFLRINKERLNRIGLPTDEIDDVYHYAVLGIQGLSQYIQNCVCEIIQCNDTLNFITSDNPATHWLQEGDKFHYLNGISLNNDLFRNPNYKILCPLHPKYFGILTPNLGLEVSNINKIFFRRNFYNDNVKELNKIIEYGADKMIFAKSLNDFIK